MVRKDWGSPVEMWVFKQFEKGSKAHTAFHVYLKSGQGIQLNRDVKCYFRDFAFFKEVIIGLFFTKLRNPIAVIEKNLKRMKLTLTGTYGPTMPTTLEGIVTVPIRSNMVRFSSVPHIVRSNTEMYGTVPSVFDAIQYGTPCNQDFVPITVPFHSCKDLKPLNAISLIIKTSIRKNALVPH